MDEENAFWMLSYLVEHILPKDLYSQSENSANLVSFHQEKFVIINLAKEILKLNKKDTEIVSSLLESHGAPLILPVLINYLNFECLFATWNKMILNRSVRFSYIIRFLTCFLV